MLHFLLQFLLGLLFILLLVLLTVEKALVDLSPGPRARLHYYYSHSRVSRRNNSLQSVLTSLLGFPLRQKLNEIRKTTSRRLLTMVNEEGTLPFSAHRRRRGYLLHLLMTCFGVVGYKRRF